MRIAREDLGHISRHLEELLIGYTTEQLVHVVACRRARENAEPPPPLEWEKRELTVEDRIWRFAQWARGWGADEDLIAVDLFRKLVRFGYGDQDASEVLRQIGIDYAGSAAS
jgi:hypothetical protein